jgi:hypothetical protein
MRQETETRQIFPIRILFDIGSTMKDGSTKNFMFFVICLNNIAFPMMGCCVRYAFQVHRYVAALKK